MTSLSTPIDTVETARTKPKITRLYYIDALRGFALILMGLDHAAFFAKTGVMAEHYSPISPRLPFGLSVVSALLCLSPAAIGVTKRSGRLAVFY